MGGENKDQPPVEFCPVKGCGKKMAAFKRGKGWKYLCPDEPKHAQAKLESRQAGGPSGKGGVKKGTPSPAKGKTRPEKPYVTRYDWRRKPKGKDENGK